MQYLYSNGLAKWHEPDDLQSGPASAPRRCTRCSCCVRSATSDTADFSYANAIETAREQGIYDPGIINVQNFLRDDAAAA